MAKGRPQGDGSPSGVQMVSKHRSLLGRDTPGLSSGAQLGKQSLAGISGSWPYSQRPFRKLPS